MKRILFTLAIIVSIFGRFQASDQNAPDTVKSAPGITLETSVDRSEIYIGDLINYRLAIIHDSSIVLTPPPIGANLGAFDVKDYQTDVDTKLKDGRIKTESRFSLTTFTTGDYIIPPIPVEFKMPDGTVKYLISEPTPIKVKSLLAEGSDSADVRDIKSPIYFKTEAYWPYYAAGAAILAAIIGYIWWWRRRKRMRPKEIIDTRKPWEIAFEQLAVLKEKGYITDGKFKLYYIELTDIVRAYFGRIYNMPVLDMTTDEFLGRIIQEDIKEEMYGRLKVFLNFADLVKFAKMVPETEKMMIDFDEATAIVESVRHDETMKMQQTRIATAGFSGGGHV